MLVVWRLPVGVWLSGLAGGFRHRHRLCSWWCHHALISISGYIERYCSPLDVDITSFDCMCQISSESVFLCRLSLAKKLQFRTNFEYLRCSCTHLFYWWRPHWHSGVNPLPTLMCKILSWSVYSVSIWQKKKQFYLFWTSAFCAVASWQHTEKVEHGSK